MSNKPKYIGTRVDDELHDKIRHRADAQGISVSDFLRFAVEQALASENTADDTPEPVNVLREQLQAETENAQFLRQELTALRQSHSDHLSEKERHIEQLREELAIKNTQIEELHKLVAMAQSTGAELTKQLDRTQLQLQDVQQREQRSFWQKLLGK
jgi:negative regulator of replication initiation